MFFILSLPLAFFNTHIRTVCVHNLSPLNFTRQQLHMLGLGLKFIPTPSPLSRARFDDALSTFKRRFRIHALFRGAADLDDENKQYDPGKFNPKIYFPNPDWQPEAASAAGERYLSQLSANLNAAFDSARRRTQARTLRSNVYRAARLAFSALAKSADIAISASDKNLGPVIQTAAKYAAECLRHLASATYKRVSRTEAHRALALFTRNVKSLLEFVPMRWPVCGLGLSPEHNTHKFITRTQTMSTFLFPVFYILWKLHKDPVVGRPIIPSVNFITTALSKYLDSRLRPVVNRLSTVVNDSLSLIRCLERSRFPGGCALSSKDVVSLYPSIPIDENTFELVSRTLLAFAEFDDCPNASDVPTLIELLRLVLLNNYFTFPGPDGVPQFYLQLIGTAMGTPVAVVFAVIFMYAVEIDLVNEFTTNGRLLLYKRFIDDIFTVFKNAAAATEFWRRFDALHPNISLTGADHATAVDYLDIHIFQGSRFHSSGTLDLSLYQKTLNLYLYLPFSSFHTIATKRAFVSGELRRYTTHCSSREKFILFRKLFFYRLLRRGYPAAFLKPLFKKAHYDRRQDYLFPCALAHKKHSAAPLVFSIPHNPVTKLMDIPAFLRQGWNRVDGEAFTAPPLVAWQTHSNVQRLVRAAKLPHRPQPAEL